MADMEIRLLQFFFRVVSVAAAAAWCNAVIADEEHFERHIRPLLAEHCWECHGEESQEGGLRLDTAAAMLKGGAAGSVVVPGRPDSSLLIKAVRQTGDLRMPPDGRLRNSQVADLEKWIAEGAHWPSAVPGEAHAAVIGVQALTPDAPGLSSALQLWLKADALRHSDGAPVHVWPDASGHGRDLSVTHGIRRDAAGGPPTLVQASLINGRPAVRFRKGAGLAASPDNPPDLAGDSPATILMVARLERTPDAHPYANLLCIGNPAWKGNPGRALAYYLEFQKLSDTQYELDFAGGWNHDVKVGPASGEYLRQPRIITIAKKPGPMTAGTRMWFDGQLTEKLFGQPLSGPDSIPDVRMRDDIGISIGKAQNWQGSLNADVAEVIVFNRVLSEDERLGVESYLRAKYEIFDDQMVQHATRQFTTEQKAHWAFQPFRKVKLPSRDNLTLGEHPIDRFIRQRLSRAGLRPAPQADRRTLIRRLTFDLTGLPPTPEDVDAFVGDPASDQDAWQTLLDELLASPAYGEHWGRHWLDVVRYADSTANDGNFVMRYAFRYRDYVVAAFNSNKPYDRFVQEQLAGDLMEGGDAQQTFERTVATGFLLVGPKALAETDKDQVKLDIADELLDVTSRAFMGLTVSCARCHDHKFDAIPTVDYYSMAGIFRSTEMFADLNRGASKWLEYPVADGRNEMVPVMAVKDGPLHTLRVHIRGSKQRLGQLAPRRFLQIIEGSGHAPVASGRSGRLELARWITKPDHPLTARVMVNRIWQWHFGTGLVSTSDNFGVRGASPTHPKLLDWLAAQFVESGWSIHHMHRLILTSNTWKQSVLSHEMGKHQRSVDPTNALLWNMSRRRLTAEQFRDALLAVSGRLDRRVGGGELCQKLFQAGEIIDAKREVSSASKVSREWEGFQSLRRSIYLPVIRNGQPEVLALFDAADPNNVTARRSETTVSSQAAFLLNSRFVQENAKELAQRTIARTPSDSERLNQLYVRLLGRGPTADELTVSLRFLADVKTKSMPGTDPELYAWQQLSQLMFCLNEFCYVE